jgi:hypothetical protein
MGSTNTKNQSVKRERSDEVWGSGDLKMMRLPGVDTTPSPNIKFYAVIKGTQGVITWQPNDLKEANNYLDSRCVKTLV